MYIEKSTCKYLERFGRRTDFGKIKLSLRNNHVLINFSSTRKWQRCNHLYSFLQLGKVRCDVCPCISRKLFLDLRFSFFPVSVTGVLLPRCGDRNGQWYVTLKAILYHMLSVLYDCLDSSLFAQVLPYCLFNVALMVLLIVLDRRYGFKVVEISNQGHSFITVRAKINI
jgi:hypothetical protein